MFKRVSYIPALCACVFSFLLFVIVFISLYATGFVFSNTVLIVSLCSFLFWFCLFTSRFIKNYIDRNDFKTLCIFVIVFIFSSLYFFHTAWFSRYLSLDPITQLVNGKTHIDTLIHSSIAESFITNGYPSLQVNSTEYHPYHYGSHFLLSLISLILNIPALITYNFLYPVLFFPLYSWLFFSVVSKIKRYFGYDPSVTIIDATGFCLFHSGILPTFLLDNAGIWLSSQIVSESYFISSLFLLFFIFIALDFPKVSSIRGSKIFISYILLPLFIIMCSCLKISTGFLLLIGICYYLFRKKPNHVETWFRIVLYFCIFIFSYILFDHGFATKRIASVSSYTFFSLFDFMKNYVTSKYRLLHILMICVLPLFIFIHSIISKGYNIKKSKFVIEELLVILLIAGLLPGFLVNIGGGSAIYFIYPVMLMSVILLLGKNIPSQLFQYFCKRSMKYTYFSLGILFLYSFQVFFVNVSPLKLVKDIYKTRYAGNDRTCMVAGFEKYFNRIIRHNLFLPNKVLQEPFYSAITSIREITKSDRKDYCVFFSPDSRVHAVFSGKADQNFRADFLFPAYTGLMIINSFYQLDNSIYNSGGQELGKLGQELGYWVPALINNKKNDIIESASKAKILGKKYMIIFTDDYFYIMDL